MRQVWAPQSKNGFSAFALGKSHKVSVLEVEPFCRRHGTIIFVAKEFYC
jgi:hypothetical protein